MNNQDINQSPSTVNRNSHQIYLVPNETVVDFFKKASVEFIIHERCITICEKYNCVSVNNKNQSRRSRNHDIQLQKVMQKLLVYIIQH